MPYSALHCLLPNTLEKCSAGRKQNKNKKVQNKQKAQIKQQKEKKAETQMSSQRKPKSELLSRLGLFKRHFKNPLCPPSATPPPPTPAHPDNAIILCNICFTLSAFSALFLRPLILLVSFLFFFSSVLCALRLICCCLLLPSHFNLNKTFVFFKHTYI